ncbi:type II secretion system F family protein [Lichenihabitans sp. Uapishka_5]|uniref:type II secretion system F family protein n=1 Tax=Lichenihabitans sp. Uapishka_5 TaxID=3037302 RepID=UPI0029E7FB27|nr:type II secretion system F family protein [Lichenihabitans sp. Uapishka_5]MDX7953082.1 type II secretion system F family protein [Lichenihabitans sp. Uapishka_5]
MFDLIAARLGDSQFLFSMLVAVAAMATVLTVAMPWLMPADNLSRRMKAVSTERTRLRERERERLAVDKKGLREKPKPYMVRVVERLNLRKWLGTDTAPAQLAAAGFRGKKAEIAFLFFRLVSPAVMLLASCFYLFVILDLDWPLTWKIGAVLAATYIGAKGPDLYLSNATQKRRTSLKRAFPNTLDLLLICVESGMSIEHAIRKVGLEIGTESVPMAEELTLTAAELSYLSDRRQAYENFGIRAGTDHIKAVTSALLQAEQYGTPMGQALRVLAQESRDTRMMEAEKKAASLPPKLTVPMILFFLPVLFAIIGTPAIIQISAANH